MIYQKPLSIYVHLPYCVKKCPYCDFNSYAVGGQELSREAEYIAALLAELSAAAKNDKWHGRKVSTIFFGGGTPSLFSGESIARVLDQIEALFGFAENIEITLEANPGTVQETLGREKLKSFRTAGVNRLSFGVQSFSAKKLQTLGRIHLPGDAERAVESALAAGFENFNLDLMFGVEGETLAEWEEDIRACLALKPKHVSLYSLTIEPGTEFARELKRGHSLKLSDEAQAEFYARTQELLAAAGFWQYEISNFAQPGMECRHNLAYWRGVDYLGVGAGAHGFFGSQRPQIRQANIPGPDDYIKRVLETGSGAQRSEELTREQEQIEFFFLRLRTAEGFTFAEYIEKFNAPLTNSVLKTLEQLATRKLVTLDAQGVHLTQLGFRFADSITTELAAAL